MNIGFPGSARILSSPQRHKEDKDAPRSCPCESSWLRVFVVRFFWLRLGCSVFICVHLSFRSYYLIAAPLICESPRPPWSRKLLLVCALPGATDCVRSEDGISHGVRPDFKRFVVDGFSLRRCAGRDALEQFDGQLCESYLRERDREADLAGKTQDLLYDAPRLPFQHKLDQRADGHLSAVD